MFENIKGDKVKAQKPEAPAIESLIADVPAALPATAACAGSECDAPCGDEPNAPKGDDALPIRFGATQVHLEVPSAFPHILERKVDGTVSGYDAYLFDVISNSGKDVRAMHHLTQILDHATEDQQVNIYVASVGGVVSVATQLVSAMRRTKAQVTTIAVGAVMSAATVIWAAGQTRTIMPGAMFMFHWSSHGDWANSRAVAQTAVALSGYTQRMLLDPMIKDGLLLTSEMEQILAQDDVYIPAAVMQARLDAAANAVAEPADQAPTTDEPAPADPAPEEEPAEPAEDAAPAEEEPAQ